MWAGSGQALLGKQQMPWNQLQGGVTLKHQLLLRCALVEINHQPEVAQILHFEARTCIQLFAASHVAVVGA